MTSSPAVVVGAGLAGCEAAYQLGKRGVAVDLWEMRPHRSTEAHKTDGLAELVCSNSFRDNTLNTAVGVLKAEMRSMDSVIMSVADCVSVPAGSALAVDRDRFSRLIGERIAALPSVRLRRGEITKIPTDAVVVVASGPLTSPALSEEITRLLGCGHLYFYDAIAPIVTAASIDTSITYRAARYGKGGDDYINCPLDRAQYYGLVDAILEAEKVETKSFERCTYFEGCMPIEELARRGRDTLAFGPMRPVGLEDPRTGKRPHAVVQLRQDDLEGRLFGLVGFQAKMTYPAQRRVLRMIPGLESAEFVRLGSLHRNTFINSPRVLAPALHLRERQDVFMAGQLVGVEGYVESAATGLLCGLNAARRIAGQPVAVPPSGTAMGSLLAYVTDPARRNFQPMNANYGLFPPLPVRLKGKEKKRALGSRALSELGDWLQGVGVDNSAQVSCTTS